jgi:hypothetical protein
VIGQPKRAHRRSNPEPSPFLLVNSATKAPGTVGPDTHSNRRMEAKLKHLEFIQGAIARMATNSFLFKGWAITLAAALAGFGAAESRAALLVIGVASTTLFWALDGYYLWLERGFVVLHRQVAAKDEAEIDFDMAIDKTDAAKRWIKTCFCRPHLIVFYGTIVTIDVIGAILIRSK